MMQKVKQSSGGGASSLEDLGVNASAAELNHVKGVTSNIQEQLDGKASALDIYPVGAVYITSTNSNPASHLGGTWKLIDKHLDSKYYDSSQTEGLITSFGGYCDAGKFIAVTNGHNITFSISFSLNVDIIDTNANIFTIDFTKLGFTRLTFMPYFLGSGDASNGVAFLGINHTSGTITMYDFNSRTDGAVLPAGTTILTTFECTTSMGYMDDAYCDKFFWERTA